MGAIPPFLTLYHIKTHKSTVLTEMIRCFWRVYGVLYYAKAVSILDEKQFALRLAQLRENKGVSAREMSLAIGQNAGYINNIESGKSLPSLTGFFYICEYLNVSENEFFDLNSVNPSKLDSVVKQLKSLDDTQLSVVFELVKVMNKK